MSGGEKTKYRLAALTQENSHLFLFDEPSTNLNQPGIEHLISILGGCESYILVSHDESILKRCCNRILEIDDYKMIDYKVDYETYKESKRIESKCQADAYVAYTEVKEKALKIYAEETMIAQRMRTRPCIKI